MVTTKYAYASRQDSILRPYYQRFLWDAILAALPDWLSPNAMTVISTISCGLSFALAAMLPESRVGLLACSVLVFAYLTLDNLDGAQARKLGRTSRRGEFLDHWLDTLNNGFVILGACMAVGLSGYFTLVVLSCGTIAFYSVQWELRATGVFRMGRIADIEGNSMVALLYLALAVFGREPFDARLIDALPSTGVLIGCGVAGQAVFTLLSAIHRVRQYRSDYVPVVVAHVATLAWAATGVLTEPTYLAIALLLNPVFTTRPIFIRLLGRDTRRLDWGVAAGLVILAAGSSLGMVAELSDTAGLLAALVAAALTSVHFVAGFTGLRGPASPS